MFVFYLEEGRGEGRKDEMFSVLFILLEWRARARVCVRVCVRQEKSDDVMASILMNKRNECTNNLCVVCGPVSFDDDDDDDDV